MIKWRLKKKKTARRISDMCTEIKARYHPPNLEITQGFSRFFLVFEHVTQEFLHGSVSDGPVEEQQLYPLRVHETQRGEKKKQLSKPKKQKTRNKNETNL